MREHDRLFIGGDWAAPAGTGTIDVISPHTEEVIGRVPEGTEADIDAAVAAARRAFDEGPWPRMTPAERAEIVGRLASIYAERQQEMADLVTAEMGSPIMFSVVGQAAIPQMVLQYYVDLAGTYTWEEERQGMLGPVTVTQEPVGVVAAIVPWNVPQFTLMLKLAPALIAGCTVVAKPSPETPVRPGVHAERVRAFRLRPGDGLPVRGEDEPGARVAQLDAIASRLVHVQEERLLDGVLVRPGLDEDAVVEEDVGGAEDVLAGVGRERDVVEASAAARPVPRVDEVVGLVGEREPASGDGAVVQADLLGGVPAQHVPQELGARLDLGGQEVDVVEAADAHAHRRVRLRLVLQGRRQLRRRLVPLRLPVDLQLVPVRVAEHVGRADAGVAVAPPDPEARVLDRLHAAVERLLRRRAQPGPPDAGRAVRGELEGVVLV